MHMRKLGRTDVAVSEICLGTMTWGQQNTETEGFEQMDYSLERGINFFDTAEMYSIPPKRETQGSTERIIGNWLKARNNRDKIVLASKVAGRSQMDWMRGRPSQLNKQDMTEALEGSLKRLQTDYIDLYQLHWPDRAVPLFGGEGNIYKHREHEENSIESTVEVLTSFVKAGKICHFGLSNETSWGTMKFVSASEAGRGARVVSIQNAYNLVNRTFEIGLAEIAMREHVGLLAYSPLAQGYLSGKYLYGARPAGARSTLFNRGQRYERPGTEDAIVKYIAIAKDFGLDINQMALAYVTTREFVTSNIIGATTMAQLKVNIDSVNVKITPELEHRINEVHQVHSNPAP